MCPDCFVYMDGEVDLCRSCYDEHVKQDHCVDCPLIGAETGCRNENHKSDKCDIHGYECIKGGTQCELLFKKLKEREKYDDDDEENPFYNYDIEFNSDY